VTSLVNNNCRATSRMGLMRRWRRELFAVSLLGVTVVLCPPIAAAAPSSVKFSADLSAWGMFQHADPVVQAVMVGLVLASLWTWTIWAAKTQEFMRARKRLADAMTILEAAAAVTHMKEVEDVAVNAMVETAEKELAQSLDLVRLGRTEGVKERTSVRLQRIEAAAARKVNRGIGVLASVGSTAPFVGLFGTVWGIMHSFMSIAGAQSTSLAVVAPGIAEALLATALGLVAAIPATLIFNGFARSSSHYKALLADCATLVLCLLSREVDLVAAAPAERPKIVAAAGR
jgi:biopolymer transport protein ExbB